MGGDRASVGLPPLGEPIDWQSMSEAQVAALGVENDARLAQLAASGVQLNGLDLAKALVALEALMDDRQLWAYRARWAVTLSKVLDDTAPAVARAVILGQQGSAGRSGAQRGV